jgi:prepilin signal peptidase PulO-like enzyme (type II secretory pathway)
LTYTGVAAGILFSLFGPPGIVSSLIGAAIGAGVLLGIRQLWLVVKGVDALGLGDVKMLAMIGAFLGWPHVWVVLLFSSVVGAVIGIGLAITGRGTMQSKLPFGVSSGFCILAVGTTLHRLVHGVTGSLEIAVLAMSVGSDVAVFATMMATCAVPAAFQVDRELHWSRACFVHMRPGDSH